MGALKFTLRLSALVFFAVGVLHLVLGPSADALLGAALPADVLSDPVLDSQNRFYGVAFSLYGALFLVCANDLSRYAPVFHATIWFFFAGGLARLVSLLVTGIPSKFVLVLLVLELLLPPVLFSWFKAVRK